MKIWRRFLLNIRQIKSITAILVGFEKNILESDI